MEKSPFREVWIEIPDGQSMCALIEKRGQIYLLAE